MPIPILMNLYCVLCFEITNNVWVNDFCVNGRISLHFYFDNCDFRKELGDSSKGS